MQSFLETGIKADTNTTQKLDRPRIRIQSQPSKREKTFSSNSFYPTIKELKTSQNISQSFYRARKTANQFKQNQEQVRIHEENKKITERMYRVGSQVKASMSADRLQLSSSSKSLNIKEKSEDIKKSNLRLANNIVNARINVKEYRKRMETEIENYLILRNSIRKYVYIPKKKDKFSRERNELKLCNKNEDAKEQNEEVRKSKKSEISGLSTLEYEKTCLRKREEDSIYEIIVVEDDE